MTKKEASDACRYFGEGVKANIHCYSGDGQWGLSIVREVSLDFWDLDSINRSLFELHSRLLKGDPLEIWPERAGECLQPLMFKSAEDAQACVLEIGKAISFIQSVSSERCWKPVPLNICETIAHMAPLREDVHAKGGQ